MVQVQEVRRLSQWPEVGQELNRGSQIIHEQNIHNKSRLYHILKQLPYNYFSTDSHDFSYCFRDDKTWNEHERRNQLFTRKQRQNAVSRHADSGRPES